MHAVTPHAPQLRTSVPHVAALVSSVHHELRFRSTYCRGRTLSVAATPHELMAILSGRPADVVLLETTDDGLPAIIPCVSAIRAAYPWTPIVAVCDLTACGIRRAAALARAGVDDVIVRDAEDPHRALEGAIASASAERMVDYAMGVLTPLLAPTVRPTVTLCLHRARVAVSVHDIARELGVHRRTLVSRFAASQLPTPSAFISWCRLLHAAYLLRDPGRSLERVALMLDFGSGTALRNMFRRYTGTTPTRIRECGGHRHVLDLLGRQIRRASVRCQPVVE